MKRPFTATAWFLAFTVAFTVSAVSACDGNPSDPAFPYTPGTYSLLETVSEINTSTCPAIEVRTVTVEDGKFPDVLLPGLLFETKPYPCVVSNRTTIDQTYAADFDCPATIRNVLFSRGRLSALAITDQTIDGTLVTEGCSYNLTWILF